MCAATAAHAVEFPNAAGLGSPTPAAPVAAPSQAQVSDPSLAPPAAAPPAALGTPPPTPPAPGLAPSPEGAPPGSPLPPSLPPPPLYPGPGVAAAPPPSKPPAPRKHVPRAGGIAVGWTYTPSNNLPLSTQTNVFTPSGVNVDARFGWQIGGIDAGWPSWIGFMAGFFYYAGDSAVSNSLGLDYGLFLKHGLFPGRRVRLFISYGLGAAQVWVSGLPGHGIGHVTRLSAGFDTRLSAHVHLSVEFAYKFIMLPYFATGTSDPPDYSFQSLNLLAGLWFGR